MEVVYESENVYKVLFTKDEMQCNRAFADRFGLTFEFVLQLFVTGVSAYVIKVLTESMSDGT